LDSNGCHDMASYDRRITVVLWIATSIFIVIFFFDSMWSASVDLADHNAVVNRLFDHWRMPVTDDLYYFFHSYPVFSHIAAAVLALPLSSPLGGVQLLTLLSLIALWSGLALILQTLPWRMRALIGVAFVLLLIFNRSILKLELHGNEIIGSNFLFPQFVGQAFVVVVIAVAALVERGEKDPTLGYLLLAVAIPVAEGFHLVPAAQLFGVLVLLIATDVYLSPKKSRLPKMAIGAFLIVASTLGIVLHPYFKNMFDQGTDPSNPGGLALLRTPNLPSLAVLSVVVAFLSALLLYTWAYSLSNPEARRNGVAAKFAALWGLSTSGICLFQIFIGLFGIGTEYACRKYAFALNTMLLLDLALLVGFFFEPRWLAGSLGNQRFLAGLFESAFISLFLLAGVFTVLPKEKVIDASDLATTERFAKAYGQTAFDNPPGKYNYAVGIAPNSPNIDYLITRGALRAPPAEDRGNTEDIYEGRPFSQLPLVGHILTSRNSKWDVPNCRTRFSSPSLVVLDGQCAISALRNSSKCVGRVDFSTHGHLALFSTEGFSGPEETGRWTEAPQASFTCQFPAGVKKDDDRIVEITASGYSPSGKAQSVLLSANNGPPKQYDFDKERTITIELSLDTDELKLDFVLPNAASPKELGFGRDERKLGIFVKSISFGSVSN
jgi:hypothetical protein